MESVNKEIKNKGGRPKKDAKEKRDEWVNVRMTADAKRVFEQEAEKAGNNKATDHARKKLFAKGSESLHNPRPLLLAISELNSEMHKVGININQIAKYVNYLDKDSMIDPEFLGEYNTHFKKMMDFQSEFLISNTSLLTFKQKEVSINFLIKKVSFFLTLRLLF